MTLSGILLCFLWITNGNVNELKLMPEDRGDLAQDVPILCAKYRLRLRCNASGGRLTWNNSRVLTFSTHDESGSTRYDEKHKLVAVLMDISHKANGESQFISELHSLDIIASMATISLNVSCSSDTSASSLPITIAGILCIMYCNMNNIARFTINFILNFKYQNLQRDAPHHNYICTQ